MDGTLIDTNLSNFLSYKKAIFSVTNTYSNLTYNTEKRINRTSLKHIIPNLTENDYERIIHEKERYYNDFLNVSKLNQEVVDILFKYSKTNKTVLVTNCRENRAITTLKHFGIEEKFKNIFFREFGQNGEKINKYQNAILKLGLTPEFIIAFENEESEISDAIKAGITIINPIII
jgi:beta-phosphoglucomutase-like phosphatase (HAD superfamily)